MKTFLEKLAGRFGWKISRIQEGEHKWFTDQAACDYDMLVLKGFANRAATFSFSSVGTEAIRNVHLSGLFRDQSVMRSRIEVGNENTQQVGIWRKASSRKGAAFVRQPDAGRFEWADKEEIEVKRRKWRVALIGESVARGYLYDPEFNPAAVLDHILQSRFPHGEFDVVDLAKLSLSLHPLKELIGKSLALKPDIIVVFAGNNWHQHLTEVDIPFLDDLIRIHGVRGLKSFIDAKSEQVVTQLIQQANTLICGTGVKLIWVVPDFNLDDWDDPEANIPLLAENETAQWVDLRERADRAFAHQHFDEAIEAATEMTILDGGASPAAPRLLAECYHQKGDLLQARRARERHRDAHGWDPTFPYSPRTSTVIQDALRRADQIPGNIVVDLPEIFARYLQGALPGRRVFLDYCHHTAEGINIAMAAVASKVIETATGQSVDYDSLRRQFLFPPPQVEGKAAFLAAIHNAHYYQGYEVVHYWTKRALQHWPECADLMQRFLDFQTRRAPVIVCKTGIELFGRRELVTLMRGRKKCLDIVLCKSMTDALRERGLDLESQISDLRVQEHSIRTGPKEVTEPYYSSAMLGTSDCAWTSKSFPNNRGQRCMQASAFWQRSKFIFFAEGDAAAALKICYRVPALVSDDAGIMIDVNGRPLVRAPASGEWKSVESPIPSDYLVNGLNEVVIAWPDHAISSDDLLGRAADAVLAGRAPHFHRVFGEIHTLRVFYERPASERALAPAAIKKRVTQATAEFGNGSPA